ncbi:PucR family transcriptional regulator [Neobacillus cucumis]|uniref:PucR family transcriptional regulator n=1 Tax=Neobacillus cucumis TaxID=1740721 RepID=UPI002853155A|nr:helix-turn-helix domain-containing protein [Neobacillus cucumis]MDR4945735.1 helix-turn-helix domain-containing protein [Neobacillus cucumis]
MSPKTLVLHGKEVEPNIHKELDISYQKLLDELNNRLLASSLHKTLTLEVMKGKGIDSITYEVYKLTQMPILLSNIHGQIISYAGISSLSQEISLQELMPFLKEQRLLPSSSPVEILHYKTLLLLTSPINIQDQLTGFCTLILDKHKDYHQEYSIMLIERISLVCSLCLFFEKTKVDSFERMKGFFFDEILSGHYSTSEEIIAKASFIQLDLSQSYNIAVIEYSCNHSDIMNALEYNKELIDYISNFCIRQKQPFLVSHNGKRIILLITETKNKGENSPFLPLLHYALIRNNPNTDFYIGVSKKTQIINDTAQAYHEAVTAIRMVTKNNPIMYFDHLGIVGALINKNNENEVRKMAQNELAPLMTPKNIELIETLFSFLLNGGNLEKAADELSLSISGLRYRISKIEELLQKDIRNPIYSYQLLLSIQSLILTKDLSFKGLK